MLIGVCLRLLGRPGADPEAPGWATIREAAIEAERAGFDRVVLEDALLYPDEDGAVGLWDPISLAGAIAAARSRIGISHAVLNNPYRHPAIVARAAATLDEISGGRCRLGIGLGNTPHDDPRFGIAADRRYPRFEESLEVIAGASWGSARRGWTWRFPRGRRSRRRSGRWTRSCASSTPAEEVNDGVRPRAARRP